MPTLESQVDAKASAGDLSTLQTQVTQAVGQLDTKADTDDVNDLAEDLAAGAADLTALQTQVTQAIGQLDTKAAADGVTALQSVISVLPTAEDLATKAAMRDVTVLQAQQAITPEEGTLLRYLYTNELCFDDADLVDIMRKTQEIQLHRVFDFAVRAAHRQVTDTNAVLWFIQADQLGLAELRATALRFLVRRYRGERAERAEQFNQSLKTLEEHPRLMMELLHAI